jgi:hypothetical protein
MTFEGADRLCAVPVAVMWDQSLTPPERSAGVRAAVSTNSTGGHPTVYVYRWDRCGRKGQRCRVTARGTMNSCRLEFEDGFVMVTSRNALMRAK